MRTSKSSFFDRIAWCFNAIARITGSPRRYAEAIVSNANLRHLENKDKRVLDVGGGTGAIAKHILPYAKEIVVLDPSKEMLARIKNAEIKKVRGIVQDAKLKKGYFDLIY